MDCTTANKILLATGMYYFECLNPLNEAGRPVFTGVFAARLLFLFLADFINYQVASIVCHSIQKNDCWKTQWFRPRRPEQVLRHR